MRRWNDSGDLHNIPKNNSARGFLGGYIKGIQVVSGVSRVQNVLESSQSIQNSKGFREFGKLRQ